MKSRLTAARGDRGAITAEFAVALPAVILILVAVLSVSVAAGAHMRAADAARAGARVAALGEDDDAVRATARRVAGGGTETIVARRGEWTTVRVKVPVAGSWLARAGMAAKAQAVAWMEPERG